MVRAHHGPLSCRRDSRACLVAEATVHQLDIKFAASQHHHLRISLLRKRSHLNPLLTLLIPSPNNIQNGMHLHVQHQTTNITANSNI